MAEDNPNGYPDHYPDKLRRELDEILERHRAAMGHYRHRAPATVRDLILTLSMFDPDAQVFVDDFAGSGLCVPPVVRLSSGQGIPDAVQILTPGEALLHEAADAERE